MSLNFPSSEADPSSQPPLEAGLPPTTDVRPVVREATPRSHLTRQRFLTDNFL